MEVLVAEVKGIPMLKVTGEVDHGNAWMLAEAVRSARDGGNPNLLFDLSGCTYLDSGGISVILEALKDVREEGWIGVIDPHPRARRILELVGFMIDPAYREFADRTEVEALAGQ